MTKNEKNTGILLPAILLILGIALIIWYFASNGGPFAAYTGRTTGTVLSCTQTRWAYEENESDAYELSVQYTVDGEEYICPRLETGNDYTVGVQIELAYHPDDPARVVLQSSAEDGYVLVIAGAVLCVLAVAVYVVGRRKGRSAA